MLFNSFPFIFVFLPIALAGFALIGRFNSQRAVLRWIVLCSMVFYAAWAPINLFIIMQSIVVNWFLASLIARQVNEERGSERMATLLLTVGIVANLCFLGYFKYKNFFIENVNSLLEIELAMTKVLLPLGISFITFQKIGFLIDVRARTIKQFTLDDFFVFVFFFPQLIAGPIVHYREMMPQFHDIKLRLQWDNIAVGMALFAMGLFKKVVLADGIAPYANTGFVAAANGEPVSLITAWVSALAFTFQIYFDFSGYSDMALGLARLFGITLPMNFNSPLKASSIIDFWNRWHLTLTRFLTDYIYTPTVIRLSRSRMAKGKSILGRKRPPLGAFAVLVAWPTMLTMFLSGFWHGAGFTYILWGCMHGVLLAINHAWRQWQPKWDEDRYHRIMGPVGFALTFVAVAVTMVVFKAASVPDAMTLYAGMLGMNGVSVPVAVASQLGPLESVLAAAGVVFDYSSGRYFVFSIAWVVALFAAAIYLPNTLDIARNFNPALYFKPVSGAQGQIRFTLQALSASALRYNVRWAFVVALGFVLGVLGLTGATEFLYWQF